MKLVDILNSIVEESKESYRDLIGHLLNKPNTGRASLLFGDEKLIDTIKNAFEYTTRNSNPKTYSVDVEIWKSNAGQRYLVIDDGDIICSAFVNNEHIMTGIITDPGFQNVGIGNNLIKLIKSVDGRLKFDSVRSTQGSRLVSKFEGQ